MVKPGGTGRPRPAISARLAPLPPSSSFMCAAPSPLPAPNRYTRLAAPFAWERLGFFMQTAPADDGQSQFKRDSRRVQSAHIRLAGDGKARAGQHVNGPVCSFAMAAAI